MKRTSALIAGFIMTVGLGGVASAQTVYRNPNGTYYATNSWQAQRMVRQAYRDILGREPDASGMAQYTDAIMRRGWTDADVRNSLMQSDEYAQTGGRQGVARSAYRNRYYNRGNGYGYGNTNGYGYGTNYGQAEEMVRQAYLSVLGREPDAVGLRSYTQHVVQDGWTQRDLVRSLRSSDEFRARAW